MNVLTIIGHLLFSTNTGENHHVVFVVDTAVLE